MQDDEMALAWSTVEQQYSNITMYITMRGLSFHCEEADRTALCQCTYKVKLRGVLITIAAVEKRYVLHIVSAVCTLSYIACNAHGPCYIVICGLSFPTLIFHIAS